MLSLRVLSSLHRVFPDRCPETGITSLSVPQNEPLSFQVAYRLEKESAENTFGGSGSLPVYVRTRWERTRCERTRCERTRCERGKKQISREVTGTAQDGRDDEPALPLAMYVLGYVPVIHTVTPGLKEVPAPGLFGDILLPKTVNGPLRVEPAAFNSPGTMTYEQEETLLNATDDSWQVLWFTLNEEKRLLEPGVYRLSVTFYQRSGEPLAEAALNIDILPAALDPQTLLYTCWIHCDCLADYYDEPVFTDRFFTILKNYVQAAADTGMNMLLMPAFTPALDTPIGFERRTAQLVGITASAPVGPDTEYKFDFSLLKRFLDMAREAGIEYFEHPHLFSQWGAKAAPKIMATVNGETRRIFGWETEATGEAYLHFLRSYLTEALAFLKEEGLDGKVLFHISDEPMDDPEQIANYQKAVNAVADLLEGQRSGDALSHYVFYEKGLVKTPICMTDTIDTFLGRCDHLWAYYVGHAPEGFSNRLLVLEPARNRMLGIQLYRYRIEGFLFWAMNFYYDVMSHGLFDPAVNPCGYRGVAGTSYLLYPGRKGEALASARLKVFYEGINDMRALQTLERKKGREACEALLHRHFGEVTFATCPTSPEQLLAFREELNRALTE